MYNREVPVIEGHIVPAGQEIPSPAKYYVAARSDEKRIRVTVYNPDFWNVLNHNRQPSSAPGRRDVTVLNILVQGRHARRWLKRNGIDPDHVQLR